MEFDPWVTATDPEADDNDMDGAKWDEWLYQRELERTAEERQFFRQYLPGRVVEFCGRADLGDLKLLEEIVDRFMKDHK